MYCGWILGQFYAGVKRGSSWWTPAIASNSAGDEDAQAQLAEIEAQVDEAAAALWGLTAGELADIRASLAELRGE